MIKIQNNAATREPIPPFLAGLKPESLLDLSWTDPSLGVQDCAWWPEEDIFPALGEFDVYGTENFTLDEVRKVVVVTRDAVPMSSEQINGILANKLQVSKSQRAEAYRNEADPLFFKWQAGESREAEWLEKREEIRGRYPYPTEEVI